MSHIANNPYPQEAPEHGLWERWRQLFYAQPLAEQLVELHAHLRGNLEHFQALSSEVSPVAVNERFHREVIDFEDSVNLLKEITAHAAENIDPTPAPSDLNRPAE
jgi:hypothetical protein